MIRDLPKKKLTKVVQRLLSDILKREDDYIETSLIEEKVRLTVSDFCTKVFILFRFFIFRTLPIPFSSLLSRFHSLTWSPEGGQPLDLSTASYQPSVQQSHLLRMPQYPS